jgi:uncharacterized membrane protein
MYRCLSLLTLLTILNIIRINTQDQQTCNYVYNGDEKKAWATNVCIPWNTYSSSNAAYYVQYICTNDDDMLVQYYSDSLCINMISSINLNDYIETSKLMNNETINYSYNCKGIDGCYVAYNENCNSNDNNNIINYVPIQTCIKDEISETSWRYDCDDDALLYFYYNGTDCGSLFNLQIITECNYVDINNEYWQFWSKCQLPPTPQPTPSPTPLPIIEPTSSPTTLPSASPTWWTPAFLDLQNYTQNTNHPQSNHASSFYSLTLLTIIVIYLSLFIM